MESMAVLPGTPSAVPPAQEIRFCRTGDGIRIAHARHGQGPPLIVVACWLSHLQHDWQSPVWRHFLDELGEFTTLIRYDLRGHGLSDWAVNDFSLEAQLSDLEAVIESEGLERFALLGMSGNSPVALAYAARHPRRVTRVILYGGWAGWPSEASSQDQLEEAAWVAMMRAGWARPDPTFRRVFTRSFIPDATELQMRWFDDLQRMSAPVENVIAARASRRSINVSDELPSVSCPTLVLHALGDRVTDYESGHDAAMLIPDARLVPLESRNHILLADEPAWQTFVGEVHAFMAPDRDLEVSHESAANVAALSRRELAIVRLTAQGLDNAAIAERLVLSIRIIERHLSNAYLKLGVSGRAARTAAAAAVIRHDLG